MGFDGAAGKGSAKTAQTAVKAIRTAAGMADPVGVFTTGALVAARSADGSVSMQPVSERLLSGREVFVSQSSDSSGSWVPFAQARASIASAERSFLAGKSRGWVAAMGALASSDVLLEAVPTAQSGSFLSGAAPSSLVSPARLAAEAGSWSVVARPRNASGGADMTGAPSLASVGSELPEGRVAAFVRGSSDNVEAMDRSALSGMFSKVLAGIPKAVFNENADVLPRVSLAAKPDAAAGLAKRRSQAQAVKGDKPAPRAG